MDDAVLTDPARFFWLRSGKGLRSVAELESALRSMEDDEFSHHLAEGRNDFAAWIEHVFGDRALAGRLRGCTSRESALSVLASRRAAPSSSASASPSPSASPSSSSAAGPNRNPAPSPDVSAPSSSSVFRPATPPNPHSSPFSPAVRAAPNRERSPSPFQPGRGPSSGFVDESRIADDPDAFVAYHVRESKEKDELADRFDAVARRIEENLRIQPEERAASEVERLTLLLTGLRERIHTARKEGKDPFFAELLLRPIPSKLRYVTLTGSDSLLSEIEMRLSACERELAAALKEDAVDVRKEVDALVAKQAVPPGVMRSDQTRSDQTRSDETRPAETRAELLRRAVGKTEGGES